MVLLLLLSLQLFHKLLDILPRDLPILFPTDPRHEAQLLDIEPTIPDPREYLILQDRNFVNEVIKDLLRQLDKFLLLIVLFLQQVDKVKRLDVVDTFGVDLFALASFEAADEGVVGTGGGAADEE